MNPYICSVRSFGRQPIFIDLFRYFKIYESNKIEEKINDQRAGLIKTGGIEWINDAK